MSNKFSTGVALPDHINPNDADQLVSVIADALTYGVDRAVTSAFDACNLQPTNRAVLLAAYAAVCVLLAHEIGQDARVDQDDDGANPHLLHGEELDRATDRRKAGEQ